MNAAPLIPRRAVLQGAAVLGGAALLAACGSNTTAATTTKPRGITITDQRGKTLVFDGPVTRIVTLPMPAASLVVAVDKSAQHLVGMHNASWTAMRDGVMGQMFPAALSVPHDIASPAFVPNVESVLALRPDVVVQWADEGTGIIAPLESAGLTVAGVTYGTQEDVNTWLTMFATMLGKPERATEMIAQSDTALQQAKAAAPHGSAAPKVLYFNRFAGGLKVAGPNTYNDSYITLVGATNPAAGPAGAHGTGMVGVDVEQVLAWNPDIILLGNFDKAMPDDVYNDKVWQGMSAVRSRRVYKVPLGGYRWDPPAQEAPLMWKWLSCIAFPAANGTALRSQIVTDYQFLYGYPPSNTQLDTILWMNANRSSANYQQFDAA